MSDLQLPSGDVGTVTIEPHNEEVAVTFASSGVVDPGITDGDGRPACVFGLVSDLEVLFREAARKLECSRLEATLAETQGVPGREAEYEATLAALNRRSPN